MVPVLGHMQNSFHCMVLASLTAASTLHHCIGNTALHSTQLYGILTMLELTCCIVAGSDVAVKDTVPSTLKNAFDLVPMEA